MRVLLLSACLFLAWSNAPLVTAVDNGTAVADTDSAAKNKQWFDTRAANRARREGLSTDAAADRIERAKNAAAIAQDLAKTAADLRVPGQNQAFARIVEFIARLDPVQAESVKAAFAALPAEPATAEPKTVTAWQTFFKAKSLTLIMETEVLWQKALDNNDTDTAYDSLQQVLTYDPDHTSMRKALNQTKVDGRYYGPKDMELVAAGLRWDVTLGWVSANDLARYEKGEYFDLQSKKWTTLEEANTLRSDPTNQWVMQTEHLELRGTAKLQDLVNAANKLEDFYKQIFASYSLFFRKGENDVKLIFGLLDHPRLVVNIAKDRDAYAASLPPGRPVGNSIGRWAPKVGASFFFAGRMDAMYHEFTHQILDVFSGGTKAPVWVMEGIAIYTENPTYRNGQLHLGDWAKNRQIRKHFALLSAGNAMTFDQLMALDPKSWKVTNVQSQYSAAGALAHFCMEADQRKYRSDYVEFVRDCYLGETQGYTLWDYLGMTRDDFIAAYKAWEKAASESLK